MKYELSGKIMTKFFGLRAKTSQLIDQCSEVKKSKKRKNKAKSQLLNKTESLF